MRFTQGTPAWGGRQDGQFGGEAVRLRLLEINETLVIFLSGTRGRSASEISSSKMPGLSLARRKYCSYYYYFCDRDIEGDDDASV